MGWRDNIKPIKSGGWRDNIKPIEKPPQEDKMSAGEGALEGFKQSGSLGFSDEAGGILDALLSKTGNLFVPEGGQNPYADKPASEVYAQGRDEERAKASKAYNEQPVAALGGGLLGGLTTLPAAGLKAAAGLGAVAGAGGAEKMSDIPLEMLKGGAVTGLMAGAGKIINKAPEILFDNADKVPAIMAVGGALKGPAGLPAVAAALARPEKITELTQKAALTAADIVGKVPEGFRKAINEAAARGPRQLAITHMTLSQQNPEYAKAMNNDPTK